MKTLIISILIGVALSVLFFVLAVLSDGACHCVKPTVVFFPYAGIALARSWESVSLPLMAIQFPLYSVIVAMVRGSRRKTLVFIALFACHVVVTLVGLKLYHR
jgi:hypothetical protein